MTTDSAAAKGRGPVRRLASGAKATLRRLGKRSVRGVGIARRRLHRLWLVSRKAVRERMWGRRFLLGRRARRFIRRQLKRTRELRRTVRRTTKIVVRSFKWTTRLHLWRTRTLKQATRAGAVPLEWKSYELDRAPNRLWIQTVQRTVSGIAASDRPILVGPWLSEIGFELLYWIPFLYWAQAYGSLTPERMWVLSRGDTSGWYRHLTGNYLEIFSGFTPQEFHDGNVAREGEQGGRKHRDLSAFDRRILGWAKGRIGAERVEVLHPSLMYNLYQAYFMKHASVRLVEAFSYYRDMSEPAGEPPAGLPERYAAVKFYWSDSLPDTPENREFVGGLIRRLARRIPVVSLDTGIRFDDHEGYRAVEEGRVVVPEQLSEPTTNLAVQTRIIRGAESFYGTYGGFSYLAPLLGVRTAAFYSRAEAFRSEHLDLAQRVFTRLGCPSFLALSMRDLGALRLET